jgi:hypothetical protein
MTSNDWVASQLRRAAELLTVQGANPFRVAAYRRAALAVSQLGSDLRESFISGGRAALDEIPGIGPSIASAIGEMLATGRWTYFEWLKGHIAPESLFQSIPGIGPALARRIHQDLHIDSLEALEVAAHDGRLAALPSFGERREAMVRSALAELLARRPSYRAVGDVEPEVALLLDVDQEYRSRSAKGELHRIAPKRFNPLAQPWLPVLHTVRGAWHFTVLYSNTARAHELDRTADWVVVYFHHDAKPEGRRTVVTEKQGPLRGLRVVRGREAECRTHYAERAEREKADVGTAGTAAPTDVMF